MKIIAKRVFEKGSRHAVMDENDIWYSYYGGGNWGEDANGEKLHGKLIQHEEYEIEYETNKKGYKNINKIERLSFKEKAEEDPNEGKEGRLEITHKRNAEGGLVPVKQVSKQLIKDKPVATAAATVRNDPNDFQEGLTKLLPTVGTIKTTEAEREVLFSPVEPKIVEIRPDGLIYLPWMEYVERLKKVFGTEWALVPQGLPSRDKNFIFWGFHLVIQGKLAGYSLGQQTYYDNNPTMSWGDACEGAKSNALMRCCKGLGIATELWRPSYVRDWKKKYAETYYDEKKKKTLWRKKGQDTNSPDVIEGELVGKGTHESKSVEVEKTKVGKKIEYCETCGFVLKLCQCSKDVKETTEKPPKFTATNQCSTKQKKDIRDGIKKTAKTYDLKVKELSKEIQTKFEFETLDQVTPEKAEEILSYLQGV